MNPTKPTPLWLIILAIYLLLFFATGYIAFFQSDSPEANKLTTLPFQEVSEIQDKDAKQVRLDALKQDAEMFNKRRELATQSFNVVLGSLLGFLSASIAYNSMNQKKEP